MTVKRHANDGRQAATLLAITLMIAAYLIMGPLRTARTDAEQVKARTDRLLTANQQHDPDTVRAQADSLRGVIRTASHNLMVMETQLPTPAELPLLLSEIADHARRTSLTVQSVAPGASVIDSPLVRHPYALSVRGSVVNIRRFVQGLSALPRAVGVDALELDTGTDNMATASLQLRTATMLHGNILRATLHAPARLDTGTFPRDDEAKGFVDDSKGQMHAAPALTLLAILHAGYDAPVRAVVRDSSTGERWTVGIGGRVGDRFVHAIQPEALVLVRPTPTGLQKDTVRWPQLVRSSAAMRTVPAVRGIHAPATTGREPLP